MIIQELNRKESIAFIKLIENFAKLDDKIEEKEDELIHKYLDKLALNSADIENMTIDEAMSIIENSTERVKMITYFEMVGMALIDDEYEEREVDFLDDIAKKFNISRSEKIAIANYYYEYDSLSELSNEALVSKINEVLVK